MPELNSGRAGQCFSSWMGSWRPQLNTNFYFYHILIRHSEMNFTANTQGQPPHWSSIRSPRGHKGQSKVTGRTSQSQDSWDVHFWDSGGHLWYWHPSTMCICEINPLKYNLEHESETSTYILFILLKGAFSQFRPPEFLIGKTPKIILTFQGILTL